MKLIGYVRVSTVGQAENGLGLDVQSAAVTGWARQHGHELLTTYSDAGVSGASEAHQRPGLSDALAAIGSGETEGIVVHRLDRLARTLTVQEVLLAYVWEAGGSVFTAESGLVLQDDPDDPMRMGLRLMAGVFAQVERAMIAKRLRDGRQAKRAAGGHWTGRPGFGWTKDAVSGELVEDAKEQLIIRRMRKLRRAGHSYGTIAVLLNASGVKPKAGSQWHASTVQRILQRTSKDVA